ncbi:MAG: 2-oxoglutarate dehydrogenase E2 component (dihydrolipoamide succinyltransferase), partial [Dokdonia sp.]
MAKFELKLPKMGESVAEATLTSWLKEVGDTIEADEAVLEIATDKVDSEVPSEVDGVLIEKLFDIDDVIQVGQTIAIIETEGAGEAVSTPTAVVQEAAPVAVAAVAQTVVAAKDAVAAPVISSEDRFYSPLVKNIARAEGVSQTELDTIPGSGKEGRVTKNDMLSYLENRGNSKTATPAKAAPAKAAAPKVVTAPVSVNGEDEVIEMTRMGKLISHHMVASVQTAAHVQSFIEADVTNIWNWRKKVKS